MTPAQITLGEPIPWYFFVLMVGFVGIVGWLGLRAGKGIWVLSKLGAFRKQLRKAEVPTGAITFTVLQKVAFQIGAFVFTAYGTWIIVDANFCSFRQVEISHSLIRLKYDCRALNKDLSLNSVSKMSLVKLVGKHNPMFRLEIVTANRSLYRSVATDNEALISDCREVIDRFRRESPLEKVRK